MKKKITVVIAACQGEKYIGEQLETLFAQTLPPDEIVICDDSPDELTYRAVKPFEENRPGVIRYSRNASRLGVSANFERGIRLATGDILFLCDQDDHWLPEKIERLASMIDSTNGGAFCDSLLVDAQLRPLRCTHRQLRGYSAGELKKLSEGTRFEREQVYLKRFPGAGHNLAFSAEFKELLLPFPNLPECHDSWIGYCIMLFSKWAVLDEALTLFRQHGDNLSRMGSRGAWGQAMDSVRRNAAGWYADLFDALLARAEHSGRKLDRGLLHRIEARRDYSRLRSDLRFHNWFVRLPLVAGEFCRGGYFRYGHGALTAAQDLFLLDPRSLPPDEKTSNR